MAAPGDANAKLVQAAAARQRGAHLRGNMLAASASAMLRLRRVAFHGT